jgi:hypothetical protein
MTLELNELERASLLALVGLAVAVMQNDEENGREFITALSQPGIQEICKSLVERLNGESADANAD